MVLWRRSSMWSPDSAGCCRRCRWSAGWCALTKSSRVDSAEAVPHRGGGARHQDIEIALLLEIAVNRNARQRGQMVAVRLEQHARPRRHRGLETQLGGNAELARPGRGLVADR